MNLDKDLKDLEVRREKLKKKKEDWEKKKKEHLSSLKYHSDSLKNYLVKIEKGLNYTGNMESHFEALKKIFGEIEETDADLKREDSDIGADAEGIKWEQERRASRNLVSKVFKNCRS